MRVIYVLNLLSRIGEFVAQVYRLRNLCETENLPFTVITPALRPEETANAAAFEITFRGVDHIMFPRETFIEDVQKYVDSCTDKVKVYPLYRADLLRREFVLKFHDTPVPFRFVLTDADRRRGLQLRRDLGVPEEAPTVVLHVREAGYLARRSAPGTFDYHNYRDADIFNYIPAIEYLTGQGYHVIRIGDPTMKKLPAMPMVVDAPHHPKYTSFVEPYFIAVSRFYFGVPSGPWALADAYGTPVLNTNAPMEVTNTGYKSDLFLFKKYFSRTMNRLLTFEEITLSHLIYAIRTEMYEESEIDLIENSPDELLAATREMLERLDGVYHNDMDVEIQYRTRIAIKKRHHLRASMCEKYPFYTLHLLKPRVCASFFLKYPELLGIKVTKEQLYKYYVKDYCFG